MSKVPTSEVNFVTQVSPDRAPTSVLVTMLPDITGDFNCNGTNDNIEIQAAIDYVASLGGGSIHIREGTYIIATRTLTIDDANIAVFGQGKSTILQMAAPGLTIFEVDNTDVSFEDLCLDGNNTNTDPTADDDRGISFLTSGSRGLVTNCYLINFPSNDSHPIIIGGNAVGVIVAECQFYNNYSFAVALASNVGYCILHGCYFVDTVGPETAFGTANIMSNNVVSGQYAATSSMTLGGDHNIATANTFIDAGNFSISGHDNIALGGTMDGSIGNGFYVTGDDCLIANYHIVDPTAPGRCIWLGAGAATPHIIGCVFEATVGIRIQDNTVTSPRLFHNDFTNATTPVQFAGTEPTVICHEMWVPVVDDSDAQTAISNIGDHFSIVMNNNQDVDVRFNFRVVSEFMQLIDCALEVVPTAADPTLRWGITTDWGLCGEAYNAGGDTIATSNDDLTQNVINCLDLTDGLDGITAGDHVGVTFTRNGSDVGDDAGDTHILGFWYKYV